MAFNSRKPDEKRSWEPWDIDTFVSRLTESETDYSYAFFLKTALRIFLKLHMKLDIDKSSKVTEPDFWKKFWFWGYGPKRGQNGPNSDPFQFFSKTSLRIFLQFSEFIQLSVLHHSVKTACLGKIWFSRYFEKGSQPIRLPRFSNLNISRTA